MKTYIAFIFLLLFSINAFGQTVHKYSYKQGYGFINKAEKNLKLRNLTKVEALLAKAKNSNYGFCGNAWVSAHSRIAIIEVELLNIQKQYDKALVILDSVNGCSFGASCSARDSLKIITLFLKFGEEKVKQSFKKINVINNPDYSDFDPTYWILLDDLNYKFLFLGPYPIYKNGKKERKVY